MWWSVLVGAHDGEHARRFAVALDVVRPVSRRRLYWTARSAFVSDQSELKAFNAVFASVFGGTGLGRDPEGSPNSQGADSAPAPAVVVAAELLVAESAAVVAVATLFATTSTGLTDAIPVYS